MHIPQRWGHTVSLNVHSSSNNFWQSVQATLDPKGENIIIIGGMNDNKRFNDIHVLMNGRLIKLYWSFNLNYSVVNKGPKKMHFGELHEKNAMFIEINRFMDTSLWRWNQPALDPCDAQCT